MIIRAIAKPIEVQAIQWTGENIDEVRKVVPSTNLFRHSSSEMELYDGTRWAYLSVMDYIVKEGESYYIVNPDSFSHYYEVQGEYSEQLPL